MKKEGLPEKIKTPISTSLSNKSIGFLGSSVTYGYASRGVSFVDFIAKRNNTFCYKEAVSGTTLVDEGKSSYVSRLKTIDTNLHFDLFVVQLSTNDVWKKKELGSPKDVEPSTICGAINYIVRYINEHWGCPVVFYTSPYFDNARYEEMIKALYQIDGILILDLYNNKDFSDISKEERKEFMKDPIHPTREGYLKWWTPKFESFLCSAIKK